MMEFEEQRKRMYDEASKRAAAWIEKALKDGFVHAETVQDSRDCCRLLDLHVFARQDDNFVIKDPAFARVVLESLREQV
jgi:hypothetical protein